MKILYSISIFIFSALVLRGQSPTFAPIGTKWGYSYSGPFGLGAYFKETVGDTTIMGRVCRKLNTTQLDYHCTGSCTTFTYNSLAFIYQSQDSIFLFSNGRFNFLYHFHAQVGDTLKGKLNIQSDTSKFVCRRVSDTIFGGTTLKKWVFNEVCRQFVNTAEFILLEKVGALNQPLGFESNCGFDGSYYTLCSFKSATTNFQSPNCITSTAENTLSDAVQISPNPAHTYLSVASNHPFVTTKIVDITGKILKIRLYTEGSSLNISDLPTGVFLLQLMDDKGRTAVKRFVKL